MCGGGGGRSESRQRASANTTPAHLRDSSADLGLLHEAEALELEQDVAVDAAGGFGVVLAARALG